jgi:hypothetical protein
MRHGQMHRDNSITSNALRFTARTTCANFQELVQRPGENIHGYYLIVNESFRRMCDAKLNIIEVIIAVEPNGMADSDNARARLAAVKKEALVEMERFLLHQLFIAVLRD